MLFVATCADNPESMAKRLENRPAHLAYLASLGARVKIGGALLTPDQSSYGFRVITSGWRFSATSGSRSGP
jgi:uncharacterized protein YciI